MRGHGVVVDKFDRFRHEFGKLWTSSSKFGTHGLNRIRSSRPVSSTTFCLMLSRQLLTQTATSATLWPETRRTLSAVSMMSAASEMSRTKSCIRPAAA